METTVLSSSHSVALLPLDNQLTLTRAASMKGWRVRRRVQPILLATLSALSFGMYAVRAQNTVFTYQGRVLDNGTNFNGTGQFKFALVTSTNFNHQATATAVLGGVSPNYFVSYCTLNNGGNGYVTAPAVTISGGGGSGATASASISGGVVASVNVITPGSGYSSTPTVTVAPPPPNISYVTFWSNDGTSVAGSAPTSAVCVGVTNGLFTVVLGDTTIANMTAISASLFTQPNLQLLIWFNDGVNGFAALSPVQNLTPAPYAIQAMNANSASNLLGTLPPSQLAGPLTLAQLPSAVVTNNSSSVNLTGTFSGDGSGLYNTVTTGNYVSAYDTTIQTPSTANAFQGVTFAATKVIGWTYSGTATNFTCGQSGMYFVSYDATVETGTISGTATISLRAYNKTIGAEIAGSESFATLTANQYGAISKSFLATFDAGDALQIQLSANSTSAGLAPSNGYSSVRPSISMTIIRIQ